MRLYHLIQKLDELSQSILQKKEQYIKEAFDRSTKTVTGLIICAVILLALSYWIILRDIGKKMRTKRERERLIAELNQSVRQNEALITSRKKAVHTITHELRTPLTALKIQLEIAEMSGDDSQMRTQALAKLSLGIERAEHLVEQLLALSRLEADNGHYDNTELLDWKDISAALFDNYAEAAKKKNITLSSYIGATSPIVRGNHVLAALLLRNLLDNAVKYAREDVPLHLFVKTRIEGNKVIISIQDNGIGIKKEDLKKIFEKFYRVSTGNVHNVKGFGLGLAYVHKIVTDLKGSIRAESELNSGTTFIITLPLKNK